MYEYKAIVNHIVDGDTADLDVDLGFNTWIKKLRFRLAGIDTPESRTQDLTEKMYGLMAKDRVKDLIPVGTHVIVRSTLDKAGKYGRVLGDISYLNDVNAWTSVNKQLLVEHLAVAYEGQDKAEIQAAHLANRVLLEAK